MSGSLWGRFARTAARLPEKNALVCGDRALSFGEWNRRAVAVGARLQHGGLRPGDRVLFWTRPGPDMAVAMLGVWAAGGIVALLDPAEPARHLLHALERVTPAVVVTDADAAWPDPGSAADVLRMSELLLPTSANLTRVRITPADPASIVFTSGSTGRPKGVTQSHGNLVRACAAVAGYLGIVADDRILCPIPWAFDYGYGQLLGSVVLGATHVLPTAMNPFAICDAITAHRPTVLPGIPSLFTYLLRGVSPFRGTDVSSVRLVTNTGGTLPGGVLVEMLDRFPARSIVLNYGLTETYRTSYLAPRYLRERPDSIGHGIPGVDVLVVRDDDSLAAPGEVGEIVHRGDFACMGYWDDPAATARALRRDPLAPADCPHPPRVLYTGDLGRIDADGFLYFEGRRDHQLKSMGVRVSPGEVEQLLQGSGLVREAAVFGVAHEMIGDEVWAAVVPADAAQGGSGDVIPALKRFAKREMSPYMVPRHYLVLDTLPRTRTGKTDYEALRRQATTPLVAPGTR